MCLGNVWNEADELWLEKYTKDFNLEQDWAKQTGRVCLLYGLGVGKDFEGRALGQRITELTLEMYRRSGYKVAHVGCSNAASAHIFHQKLNFKLRCEMELGDWLFNGKALLKDMINPTTKKPETTIRLLDFQL
eukprot:Lithocolla_globosa_v1_NODE_369_length_4280_cov_26.823000.p4 type:complete len:133 gc:universal NODE_369_length_4280_cov_26.823000:1381-983(-)